MHTDLWVPDKHLAAIVRTTTVPSYAVMHSGDNLQVLKITTVNESFVVANHYGLKRDRYTTSCLGRR